MIKVVAPTKWTFKEDIVCEEGLEYFCDYLRCAGLNHVIVKEVPISRVDPFLILKARVEFGTGKRFEAEVVPGGDWVYTLAEILDLLADDEYPQIWNIMIDTAGSNIEMMFRVYVNKNITIKEVEILKIEDNVSMLKK